MILLMKINQYSDTQTMNKEWISDSYKNAICFRDERNVSVTVYLDIVGLFETSWMTYKHHSSKKYNYGKWYSK